VSAFSVLSLRVTQREASPVNPPGLAQDFRVKLRDANGNERAIRASAFGSIPYPDQRLDSELNKSAMSTIRIPMTAYTIVCAGQPKVDLTQVTEFSLDFSLKATGHIQVDDIEFTS
jgi:hypothetical protein